MKLRNKKTGKIVELDHFSMHYNRPEEWGQQPCSTWNHSLAELNEEWEDYKPVVPLIKDEKIRKAVRAWAEANDFEDINVHTLTAGTRFSVSNYHIDFIGYFIYELEGDETYNIAELCGVEE